MIRLTLSLELERSPIILILPDVLPRKPVHRRPSRSFLLLRSHFPEIWSRPASPGDFPGFIALNVRSILVYEVSVLISGWVLNTVLTWMLESLEFFILIISCILNYSVVYFISQIKDL